MRHASAHYRKRAEVVSTLYRVSSESVSTSKHQRENMRRKRGEIGMIRADRVQTIGGVVQLQAENELRQKANLLREIASDLRRENANADIPQHRLHNIDIAADRIESAAALLMRCAD